MNHIKRSPPLTHHLCVMSAEMVVHNPVDINKGNAWPISPRLVLICWLSKTQPTLPRALPLFVHLEEIQ